MATCLKHTQSYDPLKGEFCTYCGAPVKVDLIKKIAQCAHDYELDESSSTVLADVYRCKLCPDIRLKGRKVELTEK